MNRPSDLLDNDPSEITIAYNQLWAWCHELEARIGKTSNTNLVELVIKLLASTDPYTSALEDKFGDVDLQDLWEQLAEEVGFTRSADEGSPTYWDKK